MGSDNPQSEIRNPQLECPSGDQLEAFVKGQLSEDETEAVAAHLDACDDCWRRVQSNPIEAAMDDDLRWASRLQAETRVDINVPLARLSEHLPDYDIVGEIGRGGMGIVYKAYHPRLDRMVALKVLPALLGAVRPDAISRFRREAALAARLKHNNIIAVYDCGEIDGTLYYTMELVEGSSLRDVLQEIKETGAVDVVIGEAIGNRQEAPGTRQQATEPANSEWRIANSECGSTRVSSEIRGQVPLVGPKSEIGTSDIRHPTSPTTSRIGSSSAVDRVYYRRVATWMAEVAEALDYAHGRGVIHRDVKPSNLLLSADGRIMISDFGLARGSGVETLTATRSLMGTCRYMSPEQVDESRGPIDPRTDVYALGATMYELLAFRPMFAGADDREVLGCVLNKEPTPPRKSVRQVPPDLGTICLKAVEKDRDARYATAQAMADDLRRWLLDLPIHARRPALPARAAKFARRRKLPVTLGVCLILAVTAAGVLYTGYRSWRSEATEATIAARDRGLQLLAHEIEELFFKKGDFSTALSKVEDGLAKAPDTPRLHALRADILNTLNRTDEVLEYSHDLLARDPDNAGAHWLLATVYSRSGARDDIVDEEKAAHHRKRFLRLMPETPNALFIQAQAEPDDAAAIDLLDRAIELQPSRCEFLYLRGVRRFRLKQYQASLLDAERCIVLRPRWPVPYNRRALALMALQRHDDALRDYGRAIELDPDDPVFWRNRSSLNGKIGRFQEAVADASEAIRLDPTYAEAYRMRGRARGGLGDVEEGLADLDQSIKLGPSNVQAYLDRCLLCGQAGQWEDVIADSTRVIQFSPGDWRGYNNRAEAFLRLRRYDRAIADLTHLLQLKPKASEVYRARAEAYKHTRQYDLAIDDYSVTIDLDPRSPEDFRKRAVVYQTTERHNEAIADLTRAIELEPNNPVNVMMRGMIREVSGLAEAALGDYERAASADGPTSAYARLWRYILLRQSGQNSEAASVLTPHASAVESKPWTDRLFQLFMGEVSQEDLLAAAVTDDERAEAYYYVGRKAVLDGRPDEAADAFAKCVTLDRNDVLETDFARAYLWKLGKSPPPQP